MLNKIDFENIEFSNHYNNIDFFGIYINIKNDKYAACNCWTTLNFNAHVKNAYGEYELYCVDKEIDKLKSTQTKKIKQFLYTKYCSTSEIIENDSDNSNYSHGDYSDHYIIALLDNNKYLEIMSSYNSEWNAVSVKSTMHDCLNDLMDIQNEALNYRQY